MFKRRYWNEPKRHRKRHGKRHRKRHRAAIEQQRSKDIADFLVVGPSKKKLKSRLRSLSAYLLSLTFLNTFERGCICRGVPS
jgi:hypothetical protein